MDTGSKLTCKNNANKKKEERKKMNILKFLFPSAYCREILAPLHAPQARRSSSSSSSARRRIT